MSLVAILPGEGIGNSIKLGDSLYAVINKFQKYNHKIKIVYSQKEYLETPVVVQLPEFGFRLVFENSKSQELVLIEVVDFKYVKLAYNGFNLNDITYPEESFMDLQQAARQETVGVATNGEAAAHAGTESNGSQVDQAIPAVAATAVATAAAATSDNDDDADDDSVCGIQNLQINTSEPIVRPPTLHQIYNKVFGPTYPGKLLATKASYILSYPGIAFRFKIRSKELLNKLPNQSENEVLSQLLNWDKLEDISCESVSIFDGDSWDDFFANFKLNLLQSKKVNSSSSLDSPIDKLSVNLSKGTIDIQREGQTYKIHLGTTTQQEILNILGPPEDYFNKFDSRLLIHEHLKQLSTPQGASNTNYSNPPTTSGSNSILKFHNYFKYGLDFLYDLNPDESSSNNHSKTGGVLKKVIIHNGGVAESLDFMKWNKCNWEIHTNDESGSEKEDIVVDSSMYFKDIPSEFFSYFNNENIRPVLLNRNEAEFIDNELDIIRADEVSSKSATATKSAAKTTAPSTLTHSDDADRSKIKTWGQSLLYGGKNCIWEVVQSNGCISCVTVY